MAEILEETAKQVPEFRTKLKNTNKKVQFVEATPDLFWGAGLFNKEQTINTKSEAWPGKNKLGELLTDLAKKLKDKNEWQMETRRSRAVSVRTERGEQDQSDGQYSDTSDKD